MIDCWTWLVFRLLLFGVIRFSFSADIRSCWVASFISSPMLVRVRVSFLGRVFRRSMGIV